MWHKDGIFPVVEAYLITYMAGASGAFLSLILYNLIHKQKINSVLSNNGHAHNSQKVMYTTYIPLRPLPNFEHVYRYTIPKNIHEPIIFFDHAIPDLDYFFKKYPRGKIINILVDEKMLPRILGNFYYKNTCEWGDDSKILWNKLKETDIFQSFDNPNNVPSDLVELYIKKELNHIPIPHYYSTEYTPPEKLKDRFLLIDYYDLIYNKDKVLTSMSQFTGRPVTEFIENEYDLYLEKQKILVKTKMPWVSDK